MTPEWFTELERRANALEDLSTTSSSKYDEFKEWLQGELNVEPAVCFLSELSKQWTARVGQALMGLPGLLVLLIRADAPDEAAERLAKLHRYVTGLHATLVLVGDQQSWKLGLVAGTSGRALYESLASAKPDVAQPQAPDSEPQPEQRNSDAKLDFMDLEPAEQGAALWDCLIGQGTLDFDEAIRNAANVLRDEGRIAFERLRRDGPIYAAIESAISYCARRSVLFDRPRRGCIRAIRPNPDTYPRDAWRDCVLNSVGNDWMDRDELVRASADYAVETYGLDMQRLRTGGRTDTGIRSAINGLIRIGQLERQGAHSLRRNQGVPVVSPEAEAPDSAPESSIPTASDTYVEAEVPSAASLRAMVGDIPGEAEAVFLQLLATPLKPTSELQVEVAKHLKEFEDAFQVHQFLDLDGAEQLAADSRSLLEIWDTLSQEQKLLAQAAILYFVESDEADDDFRIGGLRTDKAVMAAVKRVLAPSA